MQNTQQMYLFQKFLILSNTEIQPKSRIQSIVRAIAILRSFSEAEPALGVNEISRRLGIHKSTVSRILSTLQKEGLVHQNLETGKYRLGVGLVSLAGVALGQIDVRQVSQEHLDTLVAISQETANVAVLDGGECVTVDRDPSPQPLRYVGWIGRRMPLHCTASGQVLLTGLSAKEREIYLPHILVSYTENTITHHTLLQARLRQVQQQGYAIVQEEFEAGFNAVAAPVYDQSSTMSAAISIAGPSYRLGVKEMMNLIEPLCQATQAASRELGYIKRFTISEYFLVIRPNAKKLRK